MIMSTSSFIESEEEIEVLYFVIVLFTFLISLGVGGELTNCYKQ